MVNTCRGDAERINTSFFGWQCRKGIGDMGLRPLVIRCRYAEPIYTLSWGFGNANVDQKKECYRLRLYPEWSAAEFRIQFR